MAEMNERNGYQVLTMDKDFRENHMKIKNFLFNHSSPERLKDLSRAQIFPLYVKALELRKIDKQLVKRDKLARTAQDELIRKKDKLNSEEATHGELFRTYFRAFLNGKIDHVSDILQLVESHYLPRIEEDKQIENALVDQLRKIKGDISMLEESPGKIREDISEFEQAEYSALLE